MCGGLQIQLSGFKPGSLYYSARDFTVKMPFSTHKRGEGRILGIRLYDFSFPLLHVDIT